MPNENVFRGSDATLVLAVDDNSSTEGGLADGIISEYNLSSIVGRLQNVTIRVENNVVPYHEIGKRFAGELRPGNIEVFGHAQRAMINGALLKLLLGDGAQSPQPTASIPQPTFNMVLTVKNPAIPDNSVTLTVFGVKFDTWNFALPEDDFVMESVNFRAIRITTDETSA